MQRSSATAAIWTSKSPRLVRMAAKALAIGACLVAVRLGLTVLGLHRVRQILLPSPAPDRVDLWAARRLCRLAYVMSHLVPFASCLTRAQACQVLLARRGLASTLCLGVRPSGAGRMIAHAWLVCDGEVVTGDERHEARLFTPLAHFEPERA